MMCIFSRTELLIGKENLLLLRNSCIAIFGIGGVGSFAAEALARAGIGKLVLIDSDIICESNINRQIHASHKTIGLSKVEVMKNRIIDINPNIEVKTYQEFFSPEDSDHLFDTDYNYIIDAIDTKSSKVSLIVNAIEKGIPIISSMGAGNKLDPTKFAVSDIYSTSHCGLARVMRKELRAKGIKSLKVVYSTEIQIVPSYDSNWTNSYIGIQSTSGTIKEHPPGSISFVPSVAGLILASEVIKDLIII